MPTTEAGASGDQTVGQPPRLVVGIGASAGGLEASKSLLAAVPASNGMAFVLVMHLDPSHESHIAEILRTITAMPVAQVSGQQRLEPDHVYVIAPSASLEVHDGILSSNPTDAAGRRKPVDAFFSSLADDQRERAVAIVLSGAGNNGSSGIRNVKAAGGLCLAQKPETAQYDSMPRQAIETGVIDRVLPPELMPGLLLGYAEQPYVSRAAWAAEPTPESEPEAFAEILALLSRKHGLDSRLYKKATLLRRAERRMSLRQAHGWQAYLSCLREDPGEVAALYRDLLIGVTRFFRDPEVWEYLARELAGPVVAESSEERPLRVWVPGCATGEEPYGLAIVFLEHLARLGRASRMQIYATDVNEDALALARRGVYPSTIASDVSAGRLQRFFLRQGEQFQIRKDVRDVVTFAMQNVLTDPMFSRLDVISCRNLLIYLEPAAQERLIELFHFGLRPGGLLILGSSETVSKPTDLFQALSKKHRIYRAAAVTRAGRNHGAGHWSLTPAPVRELADPRQALPRGPRTLRLIEQLVLSRYTSACVVINQAFEILYSFGPTQDYLAQPAGEVRMDLLSWVRPGLYPRLRSVLSGVVDSKELVSITDLRVERNGRSHRVECTAEPITQLAGVEGLYLVCFRDVPPAATAESGAGEEPHEPLVRQLEDELKDARRELQSVIEQLDSTNEAYRASHEELVSLNEELQSTNEELETSKEELQSLNEEMVTINRQLEEKNTELRSTNVDLNNFFVSTEIPTIFVDRASRIRRFTPAATQVMRLVPSDVGRSLAHIKCRFEDARMLDDVARVIEKLSPIIDEVVTEEGHWYARKVLPYRTDDDRIDGVCITFTDITDQKRASADAERSRRYAEAIVQTVPTPLVVLDEEMVVTSANDCFYETFRVSRADTEGKKLYDLGNRQWNAPGLRNVLEKLLTQTGDVVDQEVVHTFETIGPRVMSLHARKMAGTATAPSILLAIEDITERKRHAHELAEQQQRKDEFLAMLGHELRNPLSALWHGLELLGEPGQDHAAAQELRQMMVRQTRRIGAMLDQLLDLARVTSGKVQLHREAVDLACVVRGAAETVRPLIEAQRHTLRLALVPDETAIVTGDAVRLTQVVENLLTNAAKYMLDGGKITLSLEVDEDTARITVRDTGIGMSADLVPHIFELFTQAPRTLDRSKGGLGLGLPLVRRLVDMHGGQVVGSSPGLGKGSEFTVTLPRLRQPAPTALAGPEAVPASDLRRRRILVVDDETDTADALAMVLNRAGHATAVSYDGAAALQAARTFKPEVVLLDIGLPRMDGYEVARRLREDLGDQNVLLFALTGYRKDAGRLDRVGFDGHLLKPPDLRQLAALIARGRTVRG